MKRRNKDNHDFQKITCCNGSITKTTTRMILRCCQNCWCTPKNTPSSSSSSTILSKIRLFLKKRFLWVFLLYLLILYTCMMNYILLDKTNAKTKTRTNADILNHDNTRHHHHHQQHFDESTAYSGIRQQMSKDYYNYNYSYYYPTREYPHDKGNMNNNYYNNYNDNDMIIVRFRPNKNIQNYMVDNYNGHDNVNDDVESVFDLSLPKDYDYHDTTLSIVSKRNDNNHHDFHTNNDNNSNNNDNNERTTPDYGGLIFKSIVPSQQQQLKQQQPLSSSLSSSLLLSQNNNNNNHPKSFFDFFQRSIQDNDPGLYEVYRNDVLGQIEQTYKDHRQNGHVIEDYPFYNHQDPDAFLSLSTSNTNSSSSNSTSTNSSSCRFNAWSHFMFPTCNRFHEMAVYDRPVGIFSHQNYHYKHVGEGTFRQTFVFNQVMSRKEAFAKQQRQERRRRQQEQEQEQNMNQTTYNNNTQYNNNNDNNNTIHFLESFAVKQFFYDEEKLDWQVLLHLHLIPKEAIILERLTNSPNIVNIYSYCGLSTILESLPMEINQRIQPDTKNGQPIINVKKAKKKKQIHTNNDNHNDTKHRAMLESDKDDLENDNSDYDDDDNFLYSQNNLTDSEKVGIALEMAQAIADLHGYKDGVIIHGDGHIDQYLVDKHGKLKLGDFNMALLLPWNDNNNNNGDHSNNIGETSNEYCKIEREPWPFQFRAPEEIGGTPFNEKIDVFTMGNNIYSLVTGVRPFYDIPREKVICEKIVKGERAFVDPRLRNHSLANAKLLDILDACWKQDDDERIDIFSVVQMLEELYNRILQQEQQ